MASLLAVTLDFSIFDTFSLSSLYSEVLPSWPIKSSILSSFPAFVPSMVEFQLAERAFSVFKEGRGATCLRDPQSCGFQCVPIYSAVAKELMG